MAMTPTPAERARTALRVAPTLLLRLLTDRVPPGGDETLVARHTVDGAAAPLLDLAEGDPVAQALRGSGAGRCAAVVEGWSLTPAPVADRVRAWVRLDGWVSELTGPERARAAATLRARAPEHPPGGPARILLRLEATEVSFADGTGEHVLDPRDLAQAAPDPLADHEAALLGHVAVAHDREVALLGRLAAHRTQAAVTDPVVVGVDRVGLRLRVRLDGGEPADVLLRFPAPVRHPGELALAVACLLERARRLVGPPAGQPGH